MAGRPKRIVLASIGSYGDVHPYVAIALGLRERGHVPVIATTDVHRQKIEALGIGFHPMRPHLGKTADAKVDEVMRQVMDRRKGTEYLFQKILLPAVRGGYEDLRQAGTGADLLITHPIVFGGILLARQTGMPWVSTVLAPISLPSVYDPWVISGVPEFFSRLGPAFHRALYWIFEKLSERWFRDYRRLERELGLPPGGNPIFGGQHSPSMVLALFSRVLATPQPDWPPNTRVTGYCFYDQEHDRPDMPWELEQFLSSGSPPIVFTLGSAAVRDAGDFFEQSAVAVRQLGRRAVLLVGKETRCPLGQLAPDVVSFDYVPHSELFPRAAVTVHQGGAGTTGQALRAGHPMLVVPFAHDQPDNAARVTRLGAARMLPRWRYNARSAAEELRILLSDARYEARTAGIGALVRAEDGVRSACDAIEEMLGKPAARVSPVCR